MEPILFVKVGHVVEPVLSRRGDFESLFATILGGLERLRVVDATTGAPLSTTEGHAGVLVPGSPASVREEAPWMLSVQAWIRDLCARGVPFLGVCFGHQLLAEALGGRVERNPRGREVGTVEIRLTPDGEKDPLFAGMPRVFLANATHVDAVVRLPEGATVLAENDHGIQAFRVGASASAGAGAARSPVSIQFHPEMDADAIRGYIGARAEAIAEEGLDPERLAHDALDCPVAVRVVENWAAALDPGTLHSRQ